MAKRKRKQKKQTLADQLREAVRKSGLTHYRIGKDSGVGAGQVDRFMEGRDIRISTADRIARVFGLELRSKKDQ